MRKTVALLLFLFCSVLGWGQYNTTYQPGGTDLTTFCTTSGNNCFKALASIAAAWIDVGGDGTLGVITTSRNTYLADPNTNALDHPQ
jgi:hypothetical protein